VGFALESGESGADVSMLMLLTGTEKVRCHEPRGLTGTSQRKPGMWDRLTCAEDVRLSVLLLQRLLSDLWELKVRNVLDGRLPSCDKMSFRGEDGTSSFARPTESADSVYCETETTTQEGSGCVLSVQEQLKRSPHNERHQPLERSAERAGHTAGGPVQLPAAAVWALPRDLYALLSKLLQLDCVCKRGLLALTQVRYLAQCRGRVLR
jgi:hypothetical protein